MKKNKIFNLLILLAALVLFVSCQKQSTNMDAVCLAAKWIRNSAVRTENGITWLAVPGDKSTINNTLYSGTPGIGLWLLHLEEFEHGMKPEVIFPDNPF